MNTASEELYSLANLWCENAMDSSQHARLQQLLRADRETRAAFLEFVQLHGQLTWDAGSIPLESEGVIDANQITCDLANVVADLPSVKKSLPSPKRGNVLSTAASVVAIVLVTIGVAQYWATGPDPSVVDIKLPSAPVVPPNGTQNSSVARNSNEPLRPLHLNSIDRQTPLSSTLSEEQTNSSAATNSSDSIVIADVDDSDVTETIDRLIGVVWAENNVIPADEATRSEWIRRLFLTVAGRIPSAQETASFLSDSSGRSRRALIQELLSDPAISENLAVVWTNLLIGRSNPRGVDQQALYEFLKDNFSENRPWIDTVGELIAAEGRSDQNGATNFLLAHLNDQATPATAVTARLFLGQQVHCTQCHDHPFAKDRDQEQFWTLNAFFKQAQRSFDEVVDTAGKKQRIWSLADSGEPGMTFYDDLRGQKKAVLPQFAGQTIPVSAAGSRRAELARLLKQDDQRLVARAMVNRMWAQFFGYGFTNPIDDLGPHNPVSHPELFDALTDAFVRSNYDLRRLTGWIASSKAFGLSSTQSAEGLAVDDPQEGGMPLFSRAYQRPMGPEQVYESIRVAIRSAAQQPMDAPVGAEHRRRWVEQFVRSYGTDENDERLEFEGNVAQALLMMNGQDLEEAIPLAAVEITRTIQNSSSAVGDTLKRLAMATLNREPTDKEEKVFRNRYRSLSRSLPQNDAIRTATEDMLWAYLNSSEFTSVH